MLYRTLSVRELRNRTRFFAKRCPFISLFTQVSTCTRGTRSLREGRSPGAWSSGERVGAQRLVGNKSGRWRRKAVSGARERGRDNGILCGLEHGGLWWWCTHRIRFWSDAHAKPGLYVCSQFKHRPWRQCTGCHPVTFSFRNISPVCPLWSTRPTIRELSKIRWLDLLYVHSINLNLFSSEGLIF